MVPIWVGDAQDGTVTRIDPVGRRIVKTIGIGAPAIGLATGAGNVWVATGGFGLVVRIDSRLGAVTRRIELGNRRSDRAHRLRRRVRRRATLGRRDRRARTIDPDSREIMRRVDLDQNPALDIAAGGGAVWAAVFSSRAKRVDASSGQVTAEFYTGAFSFAIALDRSAVWLAGADRGTALEARPREGLDAADVARRTRLDRGGTRVRRRVGCILDGSRDRSRRSGDGRVLATIPVGGEPHDVVARDGLVWVAVQRGPFDELTLRNADVTRDDPLTEPDGRARRAAKPAPRTDAPETRTALAEREHCRAIGANPAAAHPPHQLEECGVVTLHDAREDVSAEERLVGVDADTPHTCILGGTQRSQAAQTRDVEHGAGPAGDLTPCDGLALVRVEEVVRIPGEDLMPGSALRAPARKPTMKSFTGGMSMPPTAPTTSLPDRRCSSRAASQPARYAASSG